MKNIDRVASLLIYGKSDTNKICLDFFVMLASDDTIDQKHEKALLVFLPTSGTVHNGACIVAAMMISYPEFATGFVRKLCSLPKRFFVGTPEKHNEFVFMSAVLGVLMGINMGISNEILEDEVSKFFVRALTEIGVRTKEEPEDQIKHILVNNCAIYINPKDWIPHRMLAITSLLEKVGKNNNSQLPEQNSFAAEFLGQLRHKVLERIPIFTSINVLAVEFRRLFCSEE